jgi:large subunit ribosomal protein L9
VKLILTQEVGRVGAPGDIVEVKDGYGRNYLIPRGLAMPWSRGAERQITTIRRAREVREVRDLGQARELAAELERLPVTLTGRAVPGGRLFGSVTSADIAEAVRASGGPTLDKRRIQIDHPIKNVGAHMVTVRLHPEVSARVTVEVVRAG